MSTFTAYVGQRFAELLDEHRIVLYYDPKRELEPFFDGLGGLEETVARLAIDGRQAFLARFRGSFFGLRFALEPQVAVDEPEPILVYLPGARRDHRGSVLMELEAAGYVYERSLRQLAQAALRRQLTEGAVDQLLASESLTFGDVEASLAAEAEAGPSVLRSIYGTISAEALLSNWAASPEQDADIERREATGELYQLVASRLGLELPSEEALEKGRERLWRYLLVNEFRADLDAEPPSSLGMVPAPPGAEALRRGRNVLDRLRLEAGDEYETWADRVEGELGLTRADLDGGRLGSVDTFRFEEQELLRHCGELLAEGQPEEARRIAAERSRSFWVDRDPERQSHWEVCRLMGELAAAIEAVEGEVGARGGEAQDWVAAYTADEGWHRVDRLRRNLEAWAARLEHEPAAERALALLARRHDELLHAMAETFTRRLAASDWGIPGVLHQSRVYPELVEPATEPVAFILVDAMRFEMGVDLAGQLDGAQELVLRPAVAAIPTLTVIGMAALLPGASGSFSVVERKGKLAARVDGSVLGDHRARHKYFAARAPGLVDLRLEEVLQARRASLLKKLQGASRVLVRSQEIDLVGESGHMHLARHTMDSALGNVARAVRRLASLGVSRFVVTADHGHLLSLEREASMRVDDPGGKCVERHRRCWAGRGGATPTGTVRVPATALGYDSDLDFILPAGLGVFPAHDGLVYHHGGASLQELLVPVLSFRMPTPGVEETSGRDVVLSGLPERVTNRTFGVTIKAEGHLFSEGTVPVRVVLLSKGSQVGEAGLAVGAELERATGIVQLPYGTAVSVGMLLKSDDCEAVEVVVLDPQTDAVLGRSPSLPVKLAI